MSKPSYLGLMNALAVAETAAEPLFTTWADTTKDKRLAKTLRFVAMREGEHGKAFAKRMLELGFEVRTPQTDDDGPRKRMALVASAKKTDVEKFRALQLGKAPGKTDVFDNMFADKTIDPITGALLGRYIAEERDSARRLAAECERLTAQTQATKAKKPKKPSKAKKPENAKQPKDKKAKNKKAKSKKTRK